MSELSRNDLEGLVDFAAQEQRVRDALDAALGEAQRRVRFLGRYASWNGFFGSGVAALAGKIGRSRRLFLDPEQPLHALADRSVYVASFFFDAARDEFDDRDTVHRDTHRCLAQSMLKGAIDFDAASTPALRDAAVVNALTDEPEWLNVVNDHVARGYGVGQPDDVDTIFGAIGYHLGSELLADREFSIIDETLRGRAPQLVQALQNTRVAIAGQEHVAYQWIAIHSGHGGGAEADHFDWATQGARLAFRFVPRARHAALRERLYDGFIAFAHDHRHFFDHVNTD